MSLKRYAETHARLDNGIIAIPRILTSAYLQNKHRGRCTMNASKLIPGYLSVVIAAAVLMLVTGTAGAQSRPSFDGTWHTTATLPDDPAWLSEDYFCFFGCTVDQIEHFGELLDDPANDDRPLGALAAEASGVGDGDFARALTPSLRAEMEKTHDRRQPRRYLHPIWLLRHNRIGHAAAHYRAR